MLVDTHCHLTDPAFDADRGDVVDRMGQAGVTHAVVVESELARLAQSVAWAAGVANLAIATGCHPHDAAKWNDAMRVRLRDAWAHPLIRAVGEIGLDYHYDHAPRDVQRNVFAEQLALAAERGLPVVIHAREADADAAAILAEQPRVTVVLHSFSSGPVLRDAGLANGWYFSFSGMITFKSWTDADTVRSVSSDRLLLETDSPYLAPVPHRGRRNEPAFVADVAHQAATMRAVTFDQLAHATTANAMRVFW